jgi:hypothetical protein
VLVAPEHMSEFMAVASLVRRSSWLVVRCPIPKAEAWCANHPTSKAVSVRLRRSSGKRRANLIEHARAGSARHAMQELTGNTLATSINFRDMTGLHLQFTFSKLERIYQVLNSTLRVLFEQDNISCERYWSPDTPYYILRD